MSIGAGDGVETAEAAVRAEPSREEQWSVRVLAAFGGAVVVVCLLVLGSAWSTGLRPSTLETLRSDIATGSVRQWYVASSLDKGVMDFARAEQAGESGGSGDASESDDGSFATPEGFPDGGLLVWRTWGQKGWSVAGPHGTVSAVMSAPATEESTALVRQLREAEVPMKPLEFSDRSTLEIIYVAGGVLVLARLVLGPPPRVGTKWFWFWLLAGSPLGLAAIAYAVTELVGLRRRPDPPLDRRHRGIVGFAGAILLSIAVGSLLALLRSRGVPVPL